MNGTDHHGAQAQLPGLLRTLDDRFREEGARVLHSRLPDYVAAVRRGGGGRATASPCAGASYGRSIAAARTTATSSSTGSPRRARRSSRPTTRRSRPWSATPSPWPRAAWLLGAPYPQGALTQSWKYLLQNHPHDSICGCSLDEVHEQMMTRFQWSQEIAGQVAVEALHQINRRAARPALEEGEVAFRLFNPLPWAREEVWEASGGRPPRERPPGPAPAALPGAGRGRDGAAPTSCGRPGADPHPRPLGRAAGPPQRLRVRALRLAFRATLPALGYGTFVLRPLALPAWDRDPRRPGRTCGSRRPRWRTSTCAPSLAPTGRST